MADDDMSEVAEEVNTMAESASEDPGPGFLERYVVSPLKAGIVLTPLVLACSVVGMTYTGIYTFPIVEKGVLAYAGIVLAGLGLSYLLYYVLYGDEEEGYVPGPGSRLDI